MPATQSLMTTRRGEFRALYRALQRDRRAFEATPVIFCEGDSWFSTPLAMNLLDWLVWPAPADEARGVPLFGAGGLFFRTEDSGDLALDMFAPRRIRDLAEWYEGFAFDLVLVSAGGNDFVDGFLQRLFRSLRPMSATAAFQRVLDSGRYGQVRAAYRGFVERFRVIRPRTPILAHSYDYPLRMGQPAKLTLGNLGAAALLKQGAGPWIGNRVAHVLPDIAQQRRFAQLMTDGFVEHVLMPLRDDPASGRVFDFVDLRGTLRRESHWFDEMHPSGAGFALLADRFRRQMQQKLEVKLGG
ncbi:SGNH/GDSL hydrolase family protein [Lysobacter sp. M2-1]|uniref:SGNH/GDSL hydrolase family protein n=2 Tax=unclassified Lysobacter TaxID=2635362 RepID=UPI001F5A9AC5|nr:SGNH/GDSL hydrolase family protein [Lysobacter sp. M2-1]